MLDARPAKLLEKRHITMISIGGVIGGTLFIGTGTVLGATGPAAIVSYIIVGLVIVLAMRMLGEMAAVHPAKGSFATYAEKAFGPRCGFMIGWLYWSLWVILIAYEASLLGFTLNTWLPAIPIWLGALICLVTMTISNLFSVRTFGNFEYWLALIKVVAVIAFLVVGALLIVGIIPATVGTPGLSTITANGGFFPVGVGAMFTSMVLVVFSMSGAEVAAIAASESDDPKTNVIRAIKSTVARVILFFVGSVTIIAFVIPWNNSEMLTNGYVSVFEVAGFEGASTAMSVVVFLSLLSVMNSGIYTSSRMLQSLAHRGEAPQYFKRNGRYGSPVRGAVVIAIIAYLLTLANITSLESLFTFLATCTGGVILIVYVFIAASHIRIRKNSNESDLPVKMWLFPGLSYAFVAAMVVLYMSQLFIPALQLQFWCTTGLALVIALSSTMLRRERADTHRAGIFKEADI